MEEAPDPRASATHPHALTQPERDLVHVAMQELQDLTYFGTGDAADAGLEGVDAIEQVEDTRVAVAKAMKAITAFRGRVTRSRS